MVRTPCCDKSGPRKGTWTSEEDRKLMAYVTRYGCWNWHQLPKYVGLASCEKSFRLRWMNYLRPNINRGNYNKEEEDTIVRLHDSLRNRWSAIITQLPGRTYNEVKNHWHTTLKKQFKQRPSSTAEGGKDEINKCGVTREKEERKLNNSPKPLLILESSLSSSQSVSSDQNSSINTDDNTVVSGKLDSFSDDNALFEAYEANSGSFWTKSFFPDSYYMCSDMSIPFEAEFPLINGEIMYTFGFYD